MDIVEKIDILEKRLDSIEEKLEKINLLLTNNVIPNCNKMGNHINFIDSVYEKFKLPLEFICNKIKKIM